MAAYAQLLESNFFTYTTPQYTPISSIIELYNPSDAPQLSQNVAPIRSFLAEILEFPKTLDAYNSKSKGDRVKIKGTKKIP